MVVNFSLLKRKRTVVGRKDVRNTSDKARQTMAAEICEWPWEAETYTGLMRTYSYTFTAEVARWTVDIAPSAAASPDVYLVIDTSSNESFGHWVYESAVYLLLFRELRKQYPNIRLLLRTRRRFKVQFCELLHIPAEAVIFEEKQDQERCGTFLFPSPISCLNVKTLPERYVRQLQLWFAYFDSVDIAHTVTPQPGSTVILPRQSLENYVHNDRVTPTLSIQQCFPTATVFHTDVSPSLETQIATLRTAEHVVLTDGSPFLVNAAFVKGVTISIIGMITPNQARDYPKMRHLVDHARGRNAVTWYSDEQNFITRWKAEQEKRTPLP